MLNLDINRPAIRSLVKTIPDGSYLPEGLVELRTELKTWEAKERAAQSRHVACRPPIKIGARPSPELLAKQADTAAIADAARSGTTVDPTANRDKLHREQEESQHELNAAKTTVREIMQDILDWAEEHGEELVSHTQKILNDTSDDLELAREAYEAAEAAHRHAMEARGWATSISGREPEPEPPATHTVPGFETNEQWV